MSHRRGDLVGKSIYLFGRVGFLLRDMELAMNLREIYERKREAYAVWRGIVDLATKEDRPLTAEEKQTVDNCEATIDECNKLAEVEEAKARNLEKLARVSEELTATPPLQLQREVEAKPADTRSIGEKLRDYTSQGIGRREAFDLIAKDRNEAQAKAFRQFLLTGAMQNRAALQKDDDAAGGFLLAPEQFVAQLIKDLDNAVWFRQYATVIPVVGAQGIGVPTLAADMGDTTWTTELATGTADTTMTFGKRALTPHPLARKILVSKELLRSAALSVDAIVRERLAYKFGTVEETAYMTGNGAQQPLGVFTASSLGISTSRDVATNNTTTAFTVDGLIDAQYKLSSPWLNSPNLRWVFHRDAIKMARKLKTGDGQYIWAPGMISGTPDTILGLPVMVSEYAPNTFTASQYVGLIGDLSYYWIAENMSVEIQRLSELYALTNQDCFIGRRIVDGMPILEEAFARVKLAAS